MARYFGHQPGYKQRQWSAENPMSKGQLVPGGGQHYPSNYNKSGSSSGRYYRHSIDLGPGEYSRLNPASEAMQGYQRYSRWAKWNSKLKGFGTGLVAGALAQWAYDEAMGWYVNKMIGDAWNVPAPWCRQIPGPNCVGKPTTDWKAQAVSGTIPNCDHVDVCAAYGGAAHPMPIDVNLIAFSPFQITRVTTGVPGGSRSATFDCPPIPLGTKPKAAPAQSVTAPFRQKYAYPVDVQSPYREYGPSQRRGRFRRPYQALATEVVFPPGGKPPVKTPTKPVDNLPPHGRGSREDKRKANYGRAGKAYGFVTEVQDMSDCLVKALKAGGARGHAPGRWNPVGRAKWIYDHSGFLNDDAMDAFVSCVASQEVSDSLFGAASRGIDRRLREKGYLTGPRGINGGRPSGLATGPHQSAMQEAMQHAERIR